ncbi:hypothetical protein ACIQNG_01780 [Streptomyces sp. NPDC091377]|uniref:hypothetical protein n=1 Tax=unclassified Streptomyces TaxID=2593676 RepID=UPI003812BBAC
MLRHEFQPGKLVAGVMVFLTGLVYVGDAGGAWDTPWFVTIPLIVGGLFLAGAVGVLSGSIRRRRGVGAESRTTAGGEIGRD